MKNWILVKLNIKKIIDINHKNFHIKYNEEDEQRKIIEIKKVKNQKEQIEKRNVQESNQEDVLINEEEKMHQKDLMENSRNLSNFSEELDSPLLIN